MEETAVHSVSPKMMISLVTLFAMRMEQYNAWKNFRTPMQSNCLDTCGKYSHNIVDFIPISSGEKILPFSNLILGVPLGVSEAECC